MRWMEPGSQLWIRVKPKFVVGGGGGAGQRHPPPPPANAGKATTEEDPARQPADEAAKNPKHVTTAPTVKVSGGGDKDGGGDPDQAESFRIRLTPPLGDAAAGAVLVDTSTQASDDALNARAGLGPWCTAASTGKSLAVLWSASSRDMERVAALMDGTFGDASAFDVWVVHAETAEEHSHWSDQR